MTKSKGRNRRRRSVADLNIAFREKKHECGHTRAFDGPGGELAHGKLSKFISKISKLTIFTTTFSILPNCWSSTF